MEKEVNLDNMFIFNKDDWNEKKPELKENKPDYNTLRTQEPTSIKDLIDMKAFISDYFLMLKKKLALLDQQIFVILVSRIKPEDNKDTTYEIDINFIKSIFDYVKPENKVRIEKIRKSLIKLENKSNEPIKIKDLKNKKISYEIYQNLFNGLTFIYEEKTFYNPKTKQKETKEVITGIKYKWGDLIAEHLFNLQKRGWYGDIKVHTAVAIETSPTFRFNEIIEAHFDRKKIANELTLNWNDFIDEMNWNKYRPNMRLKELEKIINEFNNVSPYFIKTIKYLPNIEKIETITIYIERVKDKIYDFQNKIEKKKKKGRPKGSKNKKGKNNE